MFAERDVVGAATMTTATRQSTSGPAACVDSEGRLTPGSLPGWGMSWWVHEQGLDWRGMTPAERLLEVDRYWRDVSAGWFPPVTPEQWQPFHPFEPVDRQPEPRS